MRAAPAGRLAALGRRRFPVLPPARSVFTAARGRAASTARLKRRAPSNPARPGDLRRRLRLTPLIGGPVLAAAARPAVSSGAGGGSGAEPGTAGQSGAPRLAARPALPVALQSPTARRARVGLRSPPRRSAPPAAKTPRFLYRAKGGCRSAKMGRQTAAGGRTMQRSQSRSSLSASFEALAVYFPCMNSLEEEDGGERP